MGGFNSGRWHDHRPKDSVEDCYALDAFWWMREGLLGDGVAHTRGLTWPDPVTGEVGFSITYCVDTASDSVLLAYRLAPADEALVYSVPLLATRPHYGGVKRWFGCPACGRRVRKLFLPSGQNYFACRHCYRLAYEVQRKDAWGRANAKARKIRLRLGGSRSLVEPFPARPKGMWGRTYDRFRTEARVTGWRGLDLFWQWRDRMERKLSAKLARLSARCK